MAKQEILQESTWLITRLMVKVVTSTQVLEEPNHYEFFGSGNTIEKEEMFDLYFKV